MKSNAVAPSPANLTPMQGWIRSTEMFLDAAEARHKTPIPAYNLGRCGRGCAMACCGVCSTMAAVTACVTCPVDCVFACIGIKSGCMGLSLICGGVAACALGAANKERTMSTMPDIGGASAEDEPKLSVIFDRVEAIYEQADDMCKKYAICDKIIAYITPEGTEAIPANVPAILAGVRKQLR